MKKKILSSLFFLAMFVLSYAQSPSILSSYQGRAKIELQKKGLSEQEFKSRLAKRGIDLDKVQPEQAASLQAIIEEVIAEMEEEKRSISTVDKNLIEDEIIPDSTPVNALDSATAYLVDSIINTLGKTPAPARIYGHQIFRRGIKPLQDSSIVRVPDTYTLGVGDEITVSIFGAAQFDAKFKIGKDGYIQPSKMAKIFLKGLTWEKAQKLVQSRFLQFYLFRSDQFAMSLSQPRTITVNIFGEVQNPGSFSISAINTAFNALFAAGGPTEMASIRNIVLISGTERKEMDLYEIMSTPGAQFQYYLQDNDIIQVPVVKKLVKVEGAIQRPLLYELTSKEGLKELIDYAGGLRADAYSELVQIKRFSNNRQSLLDVNWQQLSDQNQHYPLLNGDTVFIKSIAGIIDNTVTIQGAVELPGDYSLQTTEKVSDLLQKSRLKKEARLDVAFLSRLKQDGTRQLLELDLRQIINKAGSAADLLLEADDQLLIYSQDRYTSPAYISVKGSVRDNIEYPFDADSTITIQQAILLAGGLSPEATDFGYLIRTNLNNLKEKEYVRIDIAQALTKPSSAANITLQPLDELIVLANSSYTDNTTINISGAIRFPGTFQYDTSLKLKDVLALSGGLKEEAARTKLDIFRLLISETQPSQTSVITLEIDEQFNIIAGADADFSLEPNDKIIVRTVPGYEQPSFVQLEGEVLFPGEYALTSKNEQLASLIRRAGGLSSEAFPEGATITRDDKRIITELSQALRQVNSKYNLLLQNKDIISIPKKKDIVLINTANTGGGALQTTTIGVAFDAGKSAKWYIDEYAAGFEKSAARNNVTVLYPNGAIKRTKNLLGLFKIYPKPQKGATITIGRKPVKQEKIDKDEQPYSKLKKGVVIYVTPEQVKPATELPKALDKKEK